jgi:hypothetical protein
LSLNKLSGGKVKNEAWRSLGRSPLPLDFFYFSRLVGMSWETVKCKMGGAEGFVTPPPPDVTKMTNDV